MVVIGCAIGVAKDHISIYRGLLRHTHKQKNITLTYCLTLDQRAVCGERMRGSCVVSENAGWQAEEIQRLCQDERRMRKATRRIDC